MSRRTKIILIIVSSLLILLVAALLIWNYFFLSPAQPSNVNIAPVDQEEPVSGENINLTVPTEEELDEETIQRNELMRTAQSFSERFGSYSNQNEFENIKDLKILMTDEMKNWADNYIKERMRDREEDSVYYGMTTKAISEEIKSFDEEAGQAEVLVSTQRWEAEETPANPRVFYQDILIKFVKVADEWKVDGAYWQ